MADFGDVSASMAAFALVGGKYVQISATLPNNVYGKLDSGRIVRYISLGSMR